MAGATLKVGASNTEFNKAMNEMVRQMKLAKSEFSLASTEAKLFGNETDILKTKQLELSNKMKIQNEMLQLQDTRTKTLVQDLAKQKEQQGELAKKIADTTSKYNDSVQASGKASSESKKLQAEIKALKEEYAKSESSIESQGKKIDNSKIKYNNLQKELLQTKSSLNDIDKTLENSEKEFDDLGKKVEDASGKVEKGSDKFSLFAKGIGALIVGIGGAMGAGILSVNSYSKSLNDLAAKNGIATEKLSEFGNVIKDVYGDNFGESFQDVSNSISEVNKNLKLQGDELKNTTELAIGFRDTFGYEVNESVRAAKALMDNFGVSSEEAFNLMTQGEQKGLDYSGELIDNISEYSVQFKKLGLSAEDMFNVFQDGTEDGAWNLDKIGDAVKEFSIRAVDGSNTTIDGFTKLGLNANEMASKFAKGGNTAKESFYQVVKAIGSIQDPVKQSVVGVDLFGTMWEDLGPKVVTKLVDMSNGFDKTNNSAQKLNQIKYNSFGEALSGIKKSLVSQVALPLGDSVLPMLNNFANWFKSEGAPKIQDFTSMLKNNMPLIESVISTTFGAVSKVIGFAINNFNWLAPIAGTALTAILAFKTVNGVVSGINNTVTAVKNLKQGFIDVKKNANTAVTAVKSFGNKALSGAKAAGQFAINLGKMAINFAKTAAQAGIAAVKLVAHKVATIASTIATKALSLAQAALNFVMNLNPITKVILIIGSLIIAIKLLWDNCEWFRNGVTDVFNWITNKFKEFDDFLTGIFTIDWSNSFGVFGEYLNALFANARNVWGSIKQVFSGVIDFVAGVFTGDWARAWEGVKEIFGGIMSGLSAVIKAPLNGVIGLVNMAIGGINSIKVNIPDFIPGIGGKHFGFNISKINYLYEGGIVNTPTLIGNNTVAGDRFMGKGNQAEAVIPIDPLYKKIRNIVKEESGQQPVYVIVNVDNNLDSRQLTDTLTTKVAKVIDRKQRNRKAW
jgi:phage-related minor tail protein